MRTLGRRNVRAADNIWPGFVDALSSLLLVLIFLLVVFVLAEFFLGRILSGRDESLARLNLQVLELADLLSLEQAANNDMRGEMTQLSAQLQASTAGRDELAGQVNLLLARQRDLLADLKSADSTVDETETSVDDLKLQLAAALAMVEAAQVTERQSRDRTADAQSELAEERRISSTAQRQVALLNHQIAQSRIQLASIQQALEISESAVSDQNIQIADLGRRLNVALANKVEELSRYQSEFFGRLGEILAGRSDVSIEGDRFVIQSGVLFETGAATLGEEGGRQIADLAGLLLEISSEIPPEVNWILRIDGHTDKRPINTFEFKSNWQLSAARAITVAQGLIDAGLPPERVMAAGFGEFHPIDRNENDDAYRRNRRIELKLTER
ncbi:MAG: peptidoglycan -binding protein [Alphaproteobacteria bacterium]